MRQIDLHQAAVWSKLSPTFRRHIARRSRHVDITTAIADAADRITAYRVLRKSGMMSLFGKMQHLTEAAQDFHAKTEGVLDGIAEKITAASQKRDIAAEKHHVYYDKIIAGVDESIAVIDRLSNGPLSDAGEPSQ